MNTTEIAALLNGSEYPLRVEKSVASAAKAAGIVIVYGASDDLMEFDGAIHDEIGVYGGGVAYITPEGLLTNDCDNGDCPHFTRAKKSAACIEVIFDFGDGRTWVYETDIPHVTFEIMEDTAVYCTGIVFSLSDVGRN